MSLQCFQCHHRVLTKQIFRKAKIGSRIFEVCIKFFIHPSVHKIIIFKPRIFEMLELCMSGQVFKIFLLSSLAQIMNAFIGLCEQILDSLLLPRVHCLITIRDQSDRYLDMWSSVSLSFWLSDDLGTIFAWGRGNMFDCGGLGGGKAICLIEGLS